MKYLFQALQTKNYLTGNKKKRILFNILTKITKSKKKIYNFFFPFKKILL